MGERLRERERESLRVREDLCPVHVSLMSSLGMGVPYTVEERDRA